MPQKRKLIIELEHPIDELQKLCNTIMILSEPSLPKEEIQKQRRVIRESKEYQRLFCAYVRYLKFRVALREQQIAELETLRQAGRK